MVLELRARINKSMIVGLFLVVLMVGSSIAYGALQALVPNQTPTSNIELPKQNIIDYRLNPDQQRYLLRIGKTIVEFEYSLACQDCRSLKSWLEAATNEFSDQMILSELVVSDSESLPIVRIESSYGHITLSKPTSDEMMNSFCDLFTNPPIRCATMNV